MFRYISSCKSKYSIFVALVTLVTCFAMLGAWIYAGKTKASVEIDAIVSGSDEDVFELYVNDLSFAPARASIVNGRRQLYVFEIWPSSIRLLRIDPSMFQGATITIFSITVRDSKGVARVFTPNDLRNWAMSGLRFTELTPEWIKFTSSSNDPILQSNERIRIRGEAPLIVQKFSWYAAAPGSLASVFSVGSLLLLLLAFTEARWRFHAPLVLGVVLVSPVIWKYGIDVLQEPARIDHAVGRAGFLGMSASANIYIYWLSLVWALLLAGVGAWFQRRRDRNSPCTKQAVHFEAATASHKPLGLAIAVTLLGLTLLPNIAGILSSQLSQNYTPNWDGNNGLVWDWLVHIGRVPLRDYWYPYSGRFLFALPAPWGEVVTWGYKWCLFSLLFTVLFVLLRRDWLLAVVGTVLALVAEQGGLFQGFDRYGVSVVIVLSHLAIDGRQKRLGVGHIAFWLACGLAVLFEPMQLAYAAPAVGVLLLADCIPEKERWLCLFRRASQSFLVPGLLLSALFLIIFMVGAEKGWMDLYFHMNDVANASAAPTDMLATWNPTSLQLLVLVGPLAMITLGAFEFLRGDSGDRRIAAIMFGVGLVAFMICQKHVVRPIELQLIAMVGIGLFFYASMLETRQTVARRLVIGCILGATLAVFSASGAVSAQWRNLIGAPAHAVEAARILLSDHQILTTANAERFAPGRFDRFENERRVIAALCGSAQPCQLPKFYVLGDSAVLYILAGQLPPYHVNDYNAAPIYEQTKIAEWLDQEKPVLAVWNPKTLVFDFIQNHVRNPLIYNKIIADYVPRETVGTFRILRRRHEGEPIALAFWRETLGPTVDLGHFGRVSSYPYLSTCNAGEPYCLAFLKVTANKPGTQRRISIPFTVGSQRFDIAMDIVPSKEHYYILLDRIWFWALSIDGGEKPTIPLDQLTDGVAVNIEHRIVPPDTLY